MAGGAEGKNALFRAAFFLVTPCAAKGCIKTVEVERLLQPFGLPHVGVEGAMVKRIDIAFFRLRVLIDEQFHASLFRHLVAQIIHRLELPCRIDMHQRKWRRRRIESLARQMQHYC